MPCPPHCACKCGTTGCECWDGMAIAKLERIMDDEPKDKNE